MSDEFVENNWRSRRYGRDGRLARGLHRDADRRLAALRQGLHPAGAAHPAARAIGSSRGLRAQQARQVGTQFVGRDARDRRQRWQDGKGRLLPPGLDPRERGRRWPRRAAALDRAGQRGKTHARRALVAEGADARANSSEIGFHARHYCIRRKPRSSHFCIRR